ncbi:MAG: metal-dependent transcriptional regulator [Lutibacter sp.]|uniref:metal-dependent transcriptional regulator n=1 Tax=Lutibacter sp. TaxID=1925666 RepID=UPI00299E3386|nr:metal-dependent transcriptional regulator [Lutibacter sp.]MDX1828494.1 metal-dependent transcriptional regulator [Lutibacter sp.]
MNSFTEENYLKAIYKFSLVHEKGASTNSIAKALNTKASSVTDMLKKLAIKNLINYKKYYGVTLTEKGEQIAISIIRNHRLWEVFLVEKLNFKWDEVHDLAEELEHIKSEKLINNLDSFLNFPALDPHGDPIPTKNGKIRAVKMIKLSQLTINEEGVFMHVKDSSDKFLKYLSKNKLEIGTKIKVLDKEPFDNSFKISYNNQVLIISENVAKNLYLKN